MAEKELKVKVTTETDIKDVEDLEEKLQGLQDNKVTIPVNVDAEEVEEVASNIEDVKSELSELQAKVEVDNSEIESLESELSDLEAQRLELDVETDTSEIEELDAQIAEIENILSNLQASVEVDNTEIESLESELEELEARQIELTVNVDDSSLSGAASEADGLADSLNNATGSADELNNSLGLIESASLMGVAEGVGQYAAGAENLAQEMNEAAISVGQLATNVGMAEPQMVSLINNISNATFPQEEAMAYVNVLNQMGVSASQLGDAATNMDRINDATGMGSDKVMLLTQGLQALGITADRLPESFNAIAYAEANVGGGAETLQQVLRRQAGTLNEYGMNVDATVVALSALQSQTGLTGMKLGSEFGSRLKECNGDLKALEQSLGLQEGALSNASAATAQYSGQLQQLADEEAEHKTFIDQLNAAWEDMSLSLSPILTPLMSFVGLIGQIGQFALAANSIITLAQTLGILSAANEAATISQMSLNLAFLANPVFLVVAAIVALIAVLGYLYFNNEQVRAAVDGLGQALWGIGETIYGYIMGAIEWLSGAFQWLSDSWNAIANTITTYAPLIGEVLFVMATGGLGAIALLVNSMMGGNSQLGAIFNNMLQKAWSFISGFVSSLANGARNAVTNFVNGVSQLPGRVYNELARTLDRVIEWGSQIVSRLGEIAQRAWQAFIHGLGIGSPGYIQILTLKELEDTGKRVPDAAQGIVRNLDMMASRAVDSWGNPVFDYSFKGSGEVTFDGNNGFDVMEIIRLLNDLIGAVRSSNGGNIDNTFVLQGDIDNEDRMQKFLDAVVREMEWDNARAGRTID